MSAPTAIVAEDEAPQRAELVQLLGELWPELTIVAQCEDGLAALEALRTQVPDVAFLDIRMPGLSGFELVRAADTRTHVVLVTAYAEHAVRAFEEGAVDYVLKPVARERLRTTVARLRGRIAAGERPATARSLETLSRQSPSTAAVPVRWVSATIGRTIKMLPIDEILFFQASDKYTRVVTAGDEAVIRTPLKDLVRMLDADEFWQVHRSVIVKVAAIRALVRTDDDKYELVVAGSAERLPVSAAFKDRFKGM